MDDLPNPLTELNRSIDLTMDRMSVALRDCLYEADWSLSEVNSLIRDVNERVNMQFKLTEFDETRNVDITVTVKLRLEDVDCSVHDDAQDAVADYYSECSTQRRVLNALIDDINGAVTVESFDVNTSTIEWEDS